MSAVRAKLFVSSVTRGATKPDHATIEFAAVSQGEANRSWAAATPMAQFKMTIQNPEAAARFSLGQEFYVTFEPAEPITSLATPHDYEPSSYEREWVEKNKTPYPHGASCAKCHCDRGSHLEPLRALIVRQAGLLP